MPSNAQTIVRVGYLPATHDALLFIAKDLNLFDRSKIDVQEKPYDNSVQILSDLKSGILDIGIPGIATPAAEIGGKAPLTIIGGAAAESAALVVQPELLEAMLKAKGANAKIALLRGKKVGAVRGSTGLAVLRQGLAHARMDSKALDLRDYQKPSEIISALLAHDLDAGLLWSPHMTLAEDKGFKIGMWMTEILPHHVCCRQIARDEFLGNEQAIAEYLAGLLRADKKLRDARSNPATKSRVMTAVKKYITTLSDKQIEVELFGTSPRTTVSPDIDKDGVNRYLTAMQTAGLMRKDQCANVEEKIKTVYLEKAYEKLGCSPVTAKNCVTKRSAECECLK
jgi:NitT/TauT family transport system substrate-binding protein